MTRATTTVDEVSDDVYRLELPLPLDGLSSVNVFVIGRACSGRVTVIDSGWANRSSYDAFVGGLSTLGLTLLDIQRFCITHAHEDHYSLALSIRGETEAALLLGEGERASVEASLRSDGADHGFQLLMARSGEPVRDADVRARSTHHTRQRSEMPDEWMVDGMEVPTACGPLQVIGTPGHTRGHTSFYLPANEIMFTGDHVLPVTTPTVGLEYAIDPRALIRYMGSLDRMTRWRGTTMMPAHGAPGGDVGRRAAEIRDHHKGRFEEIHQIITSEPCSAWAIAAQMRWTRHGRRLCELTAHHRALAVAEVVMHLNALVAIGTVRCDDSRATLSYFAQPLTVEDNAASSSTYEQKDDDKPTSGGGVRNGPK